LIPFPNTDQFARSDQFFGPNSPEELISYRREFARTEPTNSWLKKFSPNVVSVD
jgi:hypothetical protein